MRYSSITSAALGRAQQQQAATQRCYPIVSRSPAWSEEHIEDEADTVAAVMLMPCTTGAPPPQAWTAHRWRYADSDPALDWVRMGSQLGIGLCGDWLNGGKVEGAGLSGRALAQRIVELNATQSSTIFKGVERSAKRTSRHAEQIGTNRRLPGGVACVGKTCTRSCVGISDIPG
ncbi:MAG: hypothetical protein IPP41_07785 [Rhodocyclaceae bacterium]|nr:hypothetical protein [Rhodocyclaceae bacterium]